MSLTRMYRQQGFTITELLVGMVVGLLVMGAVIGVYLAVLGTSGSVVKGSRLNQEMSTIMTIMANDIRRAGYWGTAAFQQAQDNPFSQVLVAAGTEGNTTALRVHNNGGAGTTYVDVTYDDNTTGQGMVNTDPNDDSVSVGSCIVYSYDRDGDGTVDDDEKLGFRWDGAATDPLKIRTSNTGGGTNTCSDGNWEPVTLPSDIVITGLTFDIRPSTCENASEPDGVDDGGPAAIDDPREFDCYDVAPNTEDRTVESRQVVITLGVQLADDPLVQATLEQTVEVRNNLIWIRP